MRILALLAALIATPALGSGWAVQSIDRGLARYHGGIQILQFERSIVYHASRDIARYYEEEILFGTYADYWQ